ncbi:hypothetical protein [Campylobacter concisus]
MGFKSYVLMLYLLYRPSTATIFIYLASLIFFVDAYDMSTLSELF